MHAHRREREQGEEDVMTDMQKYGFLSPSPIILLKPPYAHLSELVQCLPELISLGATVLRRELEHLPLFDARTGDEREFRALMREYHFLQNVYVHSDIGNKVVSATLAVPSFLLAEALSRGRYHVPPVLSYSSVVLNNWKLIDECKPFAFENIQPIVTFTGTNDEQGFLAVHIAIEWQMRVTLSMYEVLKKHLRNGKRSTVFDCLHVLTEILRVMNAILAKMPRACEPHVYYSRIRPWLMSFKDVELTGVSRYATTHSFPGASGAQSSTLPWFDAVLGIEHKPSRASAYMEKLQNHMPPEHRELIERAGHALSVRDYVSARNTDRALKDAYNVCVMGVLAFRRAHSSLAAQYVHAYDPGMRGTGGSYFEELFSQYASDTEAALL